MSIKYHFHECAEPSVNIMKMEYMSQLEEPIEGGYTCGIRSWGWSISIEADSDPLRYSVFVENEEKPAISVEPFKFLKTPIDYYTTDEFHRGWTVTIDTAANVVVSAKTTN